MTAITQDDIIRLRDIERVLKEWGATEKQPIEVYSDIFHLGDGLIQSSGDDRNLKSNPIGYWRSGKEDGHFRVMLEDTFEETLKELQQADFAILNGITYFGRRNIQAAAGKMYAMIFDLDDVTGKTLNNFLYAAISGADMNIYPIPNYIALSGHGVHLYYVFDEPIPLYPNIKFQLKELKYALTDVIWNSYTSENKRRQHQGINQGFRVIGGKTKIEGVMVRAFQVNKHPFSLSQLCEFVTEEYRIDDSKLWTESKMSLAEAKKKFPEWYMSVIVNGEKRSGHWTCKRDLYDWWIRKIQEPKEGVTEGHRYFCIMFMAIYAAKCGISAEELKQDAESLLPFMNSIAPDNPFTIDDVNSALECFDERYCRFPIEDISKLSAIRIEKNKRNGRNRATHIKRITALRDLDYPDGEWRNKNGRPSQAAAVSLWRTAHPDGSKADCIKDTGLSKPTVYKHWDKKLTVGGMSFKERKKVMAEVMKLLEITDDNKAPQN